LWLTPLHLAARYADLDTVLKRKLSLLEVDIKRLTRARHTVDQHRQLVLANPDDIFRDWDRFQTHFFLLYGIPNTPTNACE
jgi:hypothetical protein